MGRNLPVSPTCTGGGREDRFLCIPTDPRNRCYGLLPSGCRSQLPQMSPSRPRNSFVLSSICLLNELSASLLLSLSNPCLAASECRFMYVFACARTNTCTWVWTFILETCFRFHLVKLTCVMMKKLLLNVLTVS